MTRNDAQLLFDWLCRHYGCPGESEGATSPAFVNGNDDQGGNGDANRNPNKRVRCHKNPAHDQSNDLQNGEIQYRAAKITMAITHGGICWRWRR
jgi:hypothetical protein